MRPSWSIDDLKHAVRISYCISDVCRELCISVRGRNFDTIKKWIKEHNLDTSHFKSKSELVKERSFVKKYVQDADVFKVGTVKQATLKKHLRNHVPYVCSICRLEPTWNFKELVLHLDHIDGNSQNNQLSNLRFLCPNCHSQTPTYSGKKKKTTDPNWRRGPKLARRKVVWPTKDELEKLFKEHSVVSISRMFGVSDTAVRKWAKTYNLI